MDWQPVLVSLRTAFAAMVVTAVLGVLAARWRIDRTSRIFHLIDGVLLFPLALPPTVVGLLLVFIFGRQSPVGSLLSEFGVQLLFSWPAAVLAAATVAFPIMYQTAKGAFQQVDPELLAAARVFGCREHRLIWRMFLPLAWPGLLAGLILSFVRALGEFGATLMVAGNIPGQTRTLPIAIFFSVESGDFATAATLSAVIVGISVSALILLCSWVPQSGGRVRSHPG